MDKLINDGGDGSRVSRINDCNQGLLSLSPGGIMITTSQPSLFVMVHQGS